MLHSTVITKTEFTGSVAIPLTEKQHGKKIDKATGLRLNYTDRVSSSGEKCRGAVWDQLDELVTDDAAAALAAKVGIKNQESNYTGMVTAYRELVISRLGESSRWDLLRYQQNSDLDGFLAYLGNHIRRPDIPINAILPNDLQIYLGTNIVAPILESNNR